MAPPVRSSRARGASFVLLLVCLAVGPVGAALQPIGRVREMARAASLTTPTGGPQRFELPMRTGGDAARSQPASWWTPTRVSGAAMTLGGAVALLLSYVLLLRRQAE